MLKAIHIYIPLSGNITIYYKLSDSDMSSEWFCNVILPLYVYEGLTGNYPNIEFNKKKKTPDEFPARSQVNNFLNKSLVSFKLSMCLFYNKIYYT